MKSVRLPSLPSWPSNQVANRSRAVGVGHRDLERRDVRAADQPLVDLGELVAEQAEGDVVPLDVGVLRPRQQPDQPRALRAGHLAQLGRGHQVLGVVEDHAEADPLGRVVLHQVLLDELVEQGEDGVGVPRPGLGLADPLGDRADHLAEPLARRCRRTSAGLAEVVPQHDVPGAEELGRQELGDGCRRSAGSPSSCADQVVDVAVEDEQAGRARRNTGRRTRGPSRGTTSARRTRLAAGKVVGDGWAAGARQASESAGSRIESSPGRLPTRASPAG